MEPHAGPDATLQTDACSGLSAQLVPGLRSEAQVSGRHSELDSAGVRLTGKRGCVVHGADPRREHGRACERRFHRGSQRLKSTLCVLRWVHGESVLLYLQSNETRAGDQLYHRRGARSGNLSAFGSA